MLVGLKRHLRREGADSRWKYVISRELLERVDHGTKGVNDILARLVARSVAGVCHRTLSERTLATAEKHHRSVRRVLAQLRLDLIASSTAHRPDRTASPRAQNATFDI